MAFCRNCGNSMPENAKFCANCGTANEPQVQPAGEQIKQEGYIPRSWMEDGGSSTTTTTGTDNTVPVSDNAASSGSYQGYGAYNGGYQGAYTPPVNSTPTKPKKKFNPALLIIGVLLVVLVVLVAVLLGGGKEPDYTGYYDCISRESHGIEIGGGADWLELKDGGKFEISVDGTEFTGTYEIEDGELTIKQGGERYYGTIEDGVIVITFEGVDCTYSLDGDGIDLSNTSDSGSSSEPAPAPEEAAFDVDFWEGDWYGWWIMNNTTGEYVELEDNCWDACARIELNSKGVGTIDLWDVDSEPGKYFAICDVQLQEGASNVGSLITTSGGMYSIDIGYGEWRADPASGYCAEYDSFIAFEGYYEDPGDSSSSFEYYIFLRPWGISWEDVRNDTNNPNMPYTDMMPLMYDDWYQAYKDGKMPSSFN